MTNEEKKKLIDENITAYVEFQNLLNEDFLSEEDIERFERLKQTFQFLYEPDEIPLLKKNIKKECGSDDVYIKYTLKDLDKNDKEFIPNYFIKNGLIPDVNSVLVCKKDNKERKFIVENLYYEYVQENGKSYFNVVIQLKKAP